MSQDQAVAMDFLGIEKGSVKNESQTDENPVTAQAKQEPVATEQMTSPAASAPAEGNKMNFSQAFSLFSKHFNEKGIGNAAVGRGENVYVGNGKEDVKGSKPMQSVLSSQGPVCPVSPCTERAVLDQLSRYFKERLAGYPTTAIEDEIVLADPTTNAKRKVATQLVLIEKKMLNSCLAAVNEIIDQLPDLAVTPCPSPYSPIMK